jgi:hypothetical protein
MSGEVHRDYEIDDRVEAVTLQQLKALGDPLRLRICDLVLDRAMSVKEIAARVGRPPGSVAPHFVDAPRSGQVEFGPYVALYPTTR